VIVLRALRALVAAFAFLTRLPVWAGPLRDGDLGRAVAFFPVVGLVAGLVLTGLGFALQGALPPPLVAVLQVAVLAVLSGGLHLDGLADLFDGLGGGRGDRAKTLAIMRDSHVGAHGAAALALLLLAKVLALAQAVEHRDFAAVLAFPAIGRWAVTPAIVLFPYARPEGLGRAFNGQAGPRQLAISTAIMGLALAGLGAHLVTAALAAGLVVLLLGLWLRRRLGGLTGDVYGAAVELAEVAALMVAAVVRPTNVN
jgi:adenosylcobinamide-GDP ribazoletransferase